ncbi:S66 family peptidase [Streptomyces griseiscabiei]|uniref:LD-carboxypeptidase n=1 Tax=Streptomyces griseiscabiei TaxID=2993540 RepID=A0ABU4L789_9ACTN|nr:S66 peptidase family protein [Streptomyces griseiscabiei]MBZ3907000.1 LD-carboxypeptidase [Streptomyces griseiscabiei]MDX2911617.1 LD-carboxypeptidase [Streptomyces griseiscabiei]
MDPSTTVVKPYAPLPGSGIGLVTPSSSVSRYPRRSARAVRALAGLGFLPVAAPHAWWQDHDRPAPEALAEDIAWCCRHEEISAILCTTGGLRSAELLPHLDFDLLRAARKPLCGFSDITSLLLGVYARAGIVTFHGPTLVPSMGDADGIDPYVADGLLASWRPGGSRVLRPPTATSVESPRWEVEDHRPRSRVPAGPWRALTPGSARGRLVGGHLSTVVGLLGTPFLPRTTDCLVFLETNESRVAVIRRDLSALAAAGFFGDAAGLVFGRTPCADRPDELDRCLLELAAEHGLPALTDVDLGHTVPITTLPIGVMATLDTGRALLRLDETAVSARESQRVKDSVTMSSGTPPRRTL